jgi:hypothetical protein
MAVAAEQFDPVAQYQLVDAIPELAYARDIERSDAYRVLNQRKVNHQHGAELFDLPLQIDALSTAHIVLEAAERHGESSPEHLEKLKGHELNCRRLVAEWYRKKKPEHFPDVRHVFDEETEDFFSHGLSASQMTYNALTPIPDDPEEEVRRINERVEDATPRIARALGGITLGATVIRTISECTNKAIADYAEDIALKKPHRGYGGYVPEIEKLMIRDIKLDTKTKDRFEEQIGLPGIYITHAIIQETLKHRGLHVEHMDKTQLHGAQILAGDDLMEFVAQLDKVASEQWCTEIFMGEVVAQNTIKDYAGFRQEAKLRQDYLEDMTQTVASFVLDLARDNVDRRQAPAMVEDFVKMLLLEIGKTDQEVAVQMFDERTALGLQKVAYLERSGQYEQAFELMQEVQKAAPGGGYCGGASCGLESVNTWNTEGKELAKKLNAKPGDAIVRDKVRACKCGRLGVVYAYNSRKVNKYCQGCSAYESKVSISTKEA